MALLQQEFHSFAVRSARFFLKHRANALRQSPLVVERCGFVRFETDHAFG